MHMPRLAMTAQPTVLKPNSLVTGAVRHIFSGRINTTNNYQSVQDRAFELSIHRKVLSVLCFLLKTLKR